MNFFKTTAEYITFLSAQGFKVTKRTSPSAIADFFMAHNIEFYFENARELKAEILKGGV
jgi:hypothetical protein